MKKVSKSLLALATILVVPTTFGAGFEKGVMWSGKAAGIGGAYGSSVVGADALYFNPAGLGDAQVGKKELSLNVSPTYAQFSGVVTQSHSTIDSKPSTVLPGGAIYSNQLTEKLGIGAGVYVSSGLDSRYPQVDFTNRSGTFANFHPEVGAKLAVTEFALGGGYKVTDNWSVGAAWRVIQASADFSSANSNGSTVGQAVSVTGAKDTSYTGFKLGVKYTSDDKKWGVGANYRSQTQFHLTGNASGQYSSSGTQLAIVGGKATLVNQLPAQFDLAGHYKICEAHTFFFGTTFTNYSANKQLLVQGTVITAGTASQLPNIDQGWSDMWNYRLGYEYAHSDDLFLRAGFIWTTQVTSGKAARATFEAPAPAKTFLVGIGTGTKNNMQLDAALEYSTLSGSGFTPTEGSGAFASNFGTFKTKAYAAHTTLKFFF